MTIPVITATDFETILSQTAEGMVVFFQATFCAPCKEWLPMLQSLSEENKLLTFVIVNIDHDPELAQQYGIDSVPSLLIFQEGEPMSRFTEKPDKYELQVVLDEVKSF